jgi:molybdopterin-binding protein
VSEVVVRTPAGTVTSIITTGSVKRMSLKEGDTVFAIIKATEVSVEKE